MFINFVQLILIYNVAILYYNLTISFVKNKLLKNPISILDQKLRANSKTFLPSLLLALKNMCKHLTSQAWIYVANLVLVSS